jgi:hypothetical protein
VSRTSRTLLLGVILFSFACKTAPVPPEAAQAEILEQALWRAGASIFAQENYDQFRKSLRIGKEGLAREKAKFGWFRDYRPVQKQFRDLVQTGRELLEKIEDLKSEQAGDVSEQAAALSQRMDRIKRMTDSFNENELVRKNLVQAEIKLHEARLLLDKEDFGPSRDDLRSCEFYVREAENAIASLLKRYLEPGQIERWRRWVEETVADSRSRGIAAIVVNKVERKLTIYKNGAAVGSYEIGLGRYGLSDKLCSGDEATPEGKYEIIKKYPNGPFYKALLINYPNEEDRKAFAAAKSKGLVPARSDVGGLIEIHGGGKDSLTKGCVGLENKDMDIVFGQAKIGTPVTIVGAVSVENTILAEIKKFGQND